MNTHRDIGSRFVISCIAVLAMLASTGCGRFQGQMSFQVGPRGFGMGSYGPGLAPVFKNTGLPGYMVGVPPVPYRSYATPNYGGLQPATYPQNNVPYVTNVAQPIAYQPMQAQFVPDQYAAPPPQYAMVEGSSLPIQTDPYYPQYLNELQDQHSGQFPVGSEPPPVVWDGGQEPLTGLSVPATENLQASAKQMSTVNNFPYHPLTENGNLGCAQVGSEILKNAGECGKTHLSVNALCNELKNQRGWYPVPPSDMKAGDCIVWGPVSWSPKNQHFGVLVEHGGQLCVVQNQSGPPARPVMIPVSSYNRPIKEVIRKPMLG